jgi:stage V sporulation protein B
MAISYPENSNVGAGSRAANIAGYVLIGKILTFLMIGVSFILVTRIIGPAQYGIYTVAIAFAGIFGYIGYFGVGTALNKFISEYKQKKEMKEVSAVISNALFILVLSAVVIEVLSVLFGGIASQYVFHMGNMQGMIELIGIYVITLIFFGALYDTLLGFGDGRQIAIIVGIEAFLQAAVSIILAFEGFGALAPILGLVVGFAAGMITGLYLIAKYHGFVFVRPSLKFMKKILTFSTPVALSNIGGNLTGGIALIFMGYFGFAVVGNIGVTSRTASLVGVVFDSISFALLPTFAAALADKKLSKNIGNLYGYAVYLGVALVGPALFFMAILSIPFVDLVFGAAYAPAALYIAIMSIGLLIGIPGSYANTLLISSNRTVTTFKYSTLINFLVLFLILIFVPIFNGSILEGAVYAVLTFLLVPILTDIFLIRKVVQVFRIKLKFGKLFRLLVADLIVSVIALPLYLFFSGALLLVSAAVVFLVLYPLASVLIGGADKGDINTIKELSKTIPLVGGLLGLFTDYANLVVR